MSGDTAAIGQDLGMAGESDAAVVQRFLVQREGRDRVDPPGDRQVDRRDEEVIRRPTGPAVDAAGRDVLDAHRGRLQAGDDPGRSARPPRGGRSAGPRHSPPHALATARSQDRRRCRRPAAGPALRQRRIGPGPRDHLGADPGHVPHRQGHQRASAGIAVLSVAIDHQCVSIRRGRLGLRASARNASSSPEIDRLGASASDRARRRSRRR